MSKHKKKFHELYIELTKLQNEVISSGKKIILIFEGRDTAGKDGTIRALTKYLSPREIRVVALSKPSEREQNEWYFQRYVSHLPSSGEIVFFNRSWYNRLGVEKVMGFCTDEEYNDFFQQVKHFEKTLFHAGIHIFKYYLDINKEQQKERLHEREVNPLKQWKISPIDKVALDHWEAYSEARDTMLKKTNYAYAPWYVVNANDKDKAHLAIMNHIISRSDYKNKIAYSYFSKLITNAENVHFSEDKPNHI
ncbi:polyphosphate kinase 2 [Tenacibaculum sp. TC6]|uniref:polyphosphate kinase 2 n=1 Tax=Tenacibaculum sp. TC6 TaxID=3423223 RepID=UPI003D367DFD